MQQYCGLLYLAQAERQGSKALRAMFVSGYGYTPLPGAVGGVLCKSQGHQDSTCEVVTLLSNGKGSCELVPRKEPLEYGLNGVPAKSPTLATQDGFISLAGRFELPIATMARGRL